MIFTEGLCKQFEDFLAVDGISLDVQPGQILVLLGPNGAGKTTTVRMLSSVLRPSAGIARVAGYDVVSHSAEVRARVGVLTEAHGLYGRMNAAEYLEFFGQLYSLPTKTIQQRTTSMLEAFGLASAGNKRLGEYSKGMRQKLALIRAMLHNPPVLLLDEPTSAMDPESARMVREAIRDQRSADRTIVLCTHNLFEAEYLADQVAIIRRGRIIFSGAKGDFIRELLGPVQYEARFAGSIPDGWAPELPEGAILVDRGPDWLHFQVENPQNANPLLLRRLIDRVDLVSFHEVERNLEQAYLEAMSRDFHREVSHV